MTHDETVQLYGAVCENYGRLPNQEQLESWQKAFAKHTQSEIASAFAKYQLDTTMVPAGPDSERPRGSIFPTPADLLAVLERGKRPRLGGPYIAPTEEERRTVSGAYRSDEAHEFRRKLWAICGKGEPPRREA